MVRNVQLQPYTLIRQTGCVVLTTLLLFGAACQLATPAKAIEATLPHRFTTTQLKPSPRVVNRLPQRVALKVRRDLAQRLNLPERRFQVVGSSRETWSDSCLGLAAPNERCAMAMVEGWRLELTDGQQTWVYRTDLRAQVIKLETRDTAELPPPIVDLLFATIARQEKVPANTLKVVEAQPKTWDGCMGIYKPGQMCTRIAIAGYRVIVRGDRQSWVYHTSQDGSQIVQNPIASGSGDQIMPSFFPAESQPENPTTDIVFKMTVSGGMDGRVTETILTTDGILYRKSNSMQASAISEPTIIKRLSPAQLQQFQQQLQQQQFPNLDGMRYLTPAAFADYPTTVFQAMGSTVAYIDLEQADLPLSLQAVIQAWQRL
ncbi:hypothetical protein ACN4EK_17525 [Pantanalinema rosaneae CENA516]|uniref:hypothetical protein n=1 Tax=Pantanalinema rosaneae TaxID=1620701 RepID=UPI003D6F039D